MDNLYAIIATALIGVVGVAILMIQMFFKVEEANEEGGSPPPADDAEASAR